VSWNLLETSPSGHYRLYERDGSFCIYVVYTFDDKEVEASVAQRGKTFDEFKERLDYFENEVNYEDIIMKKGMAKVRRSERMSKVNAERMKSGEHQFVKKPSLQKKATGRAAELWQKANSGIFEDEHHKDWTEKQRNNDGLIEKAKTMWNDEEFRESQTIVNRQNISKYNEACKNDPDVQKERSIRQSRVSKQNWQNEDYRRSVINGLLNAMEEGRWVPPYKNGKKGWHVSPKTGNKHYYRSSYEKLMYDVLDNAEDVTTYETECFRIEYYFENELHITIPDIFASFIDGTECIIEVKTEYMLNDDKTIAKLEATRKFAETNGYGFWLVTESVFENLGVSLKEVLC